MTTVRDQILETTCDLLEAQGYHATGLNQILKESGSPKGSLYHYFPDGKDGLTAEALERTGQIVLTRIQESLNAEADAAAAIHGFIMQLAHYVPSSGYRAGGPITTVALETATTNERLREVCQGIYSAWRRAFAQKLLDSGYTADRAARLAALIVATIEGAIILSRTEHSPQPLQQVAEEIRLLLHSAS